MIKKALLDCTVSMLVILIKQYEAGLLNYSDFCSNTKIKVDFLEKYLSDIDDPEKRILANNILNALKIIHSDAGSKKEIELEVSVHI